MHQIVQGLRCPGARRPDLGAEYEYIDYKAYQLLKSTILKRLLLSGEKIAK